MQAVKVENNRAHYKFWCVCSVASPTDEPLPAFASDDFRLVKVSPLSKPEATCIIFDTAIREGHHLLRMPIRLLMGLLKNGSESPRSVCPVPHEDHPEDATLQML